MNSKKYFYIPVAVVFIVLISLSSYFLGTKSKSKSSTPQNVTEPTQNSVPTVTIETLEATLSATPKEASPSVTSGLKISIMPKISLILKISPSVTPTPTTKLILNPNLKKVDIIPSPTPKIVLKLTPVKIGL